MKPTLTRAGLGVSLVALLLTALAGFQASAAEWQDCPDGRVCVYTDTDGQGRELPSAPDAAIQVHTAQWDNQISSVHNNSPYWACLYEDTYYGSVVQAIRPGFQGNLADTSTQLDDRVSSQKSAKSKSGCFTGFERCPDGNLCLFTQPSGRGAMTTSQGDVDRYDAAWDNRVVSVANYTNLHVCFYRDPGYGGSWTDAGTTYRTYVVLKTDATVIPQPYAGSFSAHKLVEGTSAC